MRSDMRLSMVRHLADWHPRIKVRARDTADDLARKHSEEHWRYGSRTHIHAGPNGGPADRPPGWTTGADVVTLNGES